MEKILNIVLDSLQVLGKLQNHFNNDKFKHYVVKGWETPSFSPIILMPNKKLLKSDLYELELYFNTYKVVNAFINPAPYFNFIKHSGFYDDFEIRRLCFANGWEIEERPLNFNILKENIPLNLGKDIKFSIGNFSSNLFKRDYFKLIENNFKISPKAIKKISSNKNGSYITLVYYKDLAIGGGYVHVYNKSAFMTWGCVEEKFRNKGINDLLFSLSKMIASSYGISTCVYSTRNKFKK